MAKSSSVRSRRSRQVAPGSNSRGFFLNRRFGGSTGGRDPWRARLISSLLRPVPPGYIGQEAMRATARVLGDLRARRARTALTSTGRGRDVSSRLPVSSRVITPLGKPVLFRRSSPCVARGQRRQVMFAMEVAGKKWGAGGPQMKGARFTVESQYTCR